MKYLKSLFIMAVMSLTAASVFAGPGKADAEAMVKEAIAYAKENGKDKLVAEVNNPKGKFNKGELYVFVYDLNGTVVGNPANPAIIGKNQVDKPDSNGKFFRKEILETAKAKGEGWVEYSLKNPVTGQEAQKTTYFRKDGDLIFGAGVYKN